MDTKSSDTNDLVSTIESISLRFGSISASSSVTHDGTNDQESKKRKNTNENRVGWKSKEKSLSEEPIGLAGLRRSEERNRDLRGSTGVFGFDKKCKLRFKSPSDNSQSMERTNYHQTCLVKRNEMSLRNHIRTRLSASASESSLSTTMSSSNPIISKNISPKKIPIPKIVEGQTIKPDEITEEQPMSTRRQALKRKVKIDQ